jgi:hypothetical protein
MSKENVVSNRTFINNDTAEQIDRYIDDICSNPEFLCKNKEMCAASTSIYSNIQNVEKICKDIKKANECEDNVKECVVTTQNSFDEARKTITNSIAHLIPAVSRWKYSIYSASTTSSTTNGCKM